MRKEIIIINNNGINRDINVLKTVIKALRHATYPAKGYFQCKENHFEARPFRAKFEENR